MALNIGFYVYAFIGHTRADQLLPQLLMEQFDSLPIHCTGDTLNICMKVFGSEKIIFDNFSLIRCLYMHRWCLYEPINSYHSF